MFLFMSSSVSHFDHNLQLHQPRLESFAWIHGWCQMILTPNINECSLHLGFNSIQCCNAPAHYQDPTLHCSVVVVSVEVLTYNWGLQWLDTHKWQLPTQQQLVTTLSVGWALGVCTLLEWWHHYTLGSMGRGAANVNTDTVIRHILFLKLYCCRPWI